MTTNTETPKPMRIFLSYARGDDEAFVKRLCADLTAAGFQVWFDRESLLSRGLTFHQEIKDAIRTEVDRVVYVGGPKAAQSAYVREEWQFALECDQVVVVPIRRLGDMENVPGELSLLHCEDFRDDANYPAALAKLIASLREPNPKLGALHAVPTLPPSLIARPDLMCRVRDALLVDLQKPQVITSADAKVGVQGMGGIGKSVLAAALARNREVRRSYPDGVIWVSCGQNLGTDDLLARLRDVSKHLGGDTSFTSLPQAQGMLRELLQTKAVLLVLDDVWCAKDAQAFDVLGPRCRMLVTTRDAGILHALHGEHIPISLFTETEALQLLADAVTAKERPVSVADLPPEAHEVVRECGCLPLALALCGGMVKSGNSWLDVVDALSEADLDWAENRVGANEQHRSIWNAMTASYAVLSAEEKARFAELAVFLTDGTVPEPAAHVLWHHTARLSGRNCTKLLINLSERSLIQLDQKTDPDGTIRRRFRLHDLLHDYAVRVVGDMQALHRTLLDAYRAKCPDGWHSGPNDGYFLESICRHLSESAGNWDEVVDLLCEMRFVEARCRVRQVFELIADYRLAHENLPEAQVDLREERAREERGELWTKEIIKYARQWSDRRDRLERGEAVTEPEPELPEPVPTCEMWSEEKIQADCARKICSPTRRDRLEAFSGFVRGQCYPLIEHGHRPGFVRQQAFNTAPAGAVHAAAVPPQSVPMFLRQFSPADVYNPYPPILQVLEGHTGPVLCVSISADGRKVISGSDDCTLRVWDMESGRCLQVLTAHPNHVVCVSISADGRRAISGSQGEGGVLQLWDLEAGVCLGVLQTNPCPFTCVTLSADGQRAVSISSGKLQVWNLNSRQCVRVVDIHRSPQPGGLSVTPDFRWALTAGNSDELCLWDLERDGEPLRWIVNEEDVYHVSISADGCRAVSGGLCTEFETWELGAGLVQWSHRGGGIPRPPVCFSVSADYHRVACWITDEAIVLCNLWGHTKGRWLQSTVPIDTASRMCMSTTPDLRRAVLGTNYGRVLLVWDLERGWSPERVSSDKSITRPPMDIPRLIKGMQKHVKKRIGQWRAIMGGMDSSPHLPRQTEDCVSCHSVSEEDRLLVGVLPDEENRRSSDTLAIWDARTGQIKQLLRGHTGTVLCVSADERFVVSGSYDRTLRIWDIATGLCLQVLCVGEPVAHVDGPFNGLLVYHGSWTRKQFLLRLHSVSDLE